jgi:hypothetical protein
MPRPMNNLAIPGLIVGIVVCGLAGMIMSIIARKQINASGDQEGGKGITTAGIIVGAIKTVIEVVYLFAIVADGL